MSRCCSRACCSCAARQWRRSRRNSRNASPPTQLICVPVYSWQRNRFWRKIMRREWKQLLEVMRRDRRFDNDAGRQGLIAAFELLDGQRSSGYSIPTQDGGVAVLNAGHGCSGGDAAFSCARQACNATLSAGTVA